MVPASVIEAKVTDSLKKSAALDKFWQHTVTGEMLQAELDRMAKQTRDPATLKELFEALRNDPRLIAETLARETLSDRLIRNWYAYDTRISDINNVCDSWGSATNLLNAPNGRSRQTAIWTGSEMIVWRGIRQQWSVLQHGRTIQPCD